MTYDQIVRAVGPFELSEYLGLAAVYASPAATGPFPSTARLPRVGAAAEPR